MKRRSLLAAMIGVVLAPFASSGQAKAAGSRKRSEARRPWRPVEQLRTDAGQFDEALFLDVLDRVRKRVCPRDMTSRRPRNRQPGVYSIAFDRATHEGTSTAAAHVDPREEFHGFMDFILEVKARCRCAVRDVRLPDKTKKHSSDTCYFVFRGRKLVLLVSGETLDN